GNVAVSHGLGNQHQTPGDVSSRENMMCRRLEQRTDLHIPTRIQIHSRRSKVKSGGIGGPADGNHCEGSFARELLSVFRVEHANSGRGLLETLNLSEVLVDRDTRIAEGVGNGRRNIFVFGWQYALTGFEEMNLGAESIKDGSYLRAGRARADYQHGRWNRGQVPGIAVSCGEFSARYRQFFAATTGAQNDPVALQTDSS